MKKITDAILSNNYHEKSTFQEHFFAKEEIILTEEESKKDKHADLIEKELDDIIRKDDIILSILISIFGIANVLFF